MYVVFIGGIFLFLLVFVFYDIFGNNINVIMIGICEELVKVIVVIYFVCNFKYRYIFNGFFLGVVIGVGFVVFEIVGYVLWVFFFGSFYMFYFIIFWCSIFVFGGYVVWVVLIGVVVCIV